MRAEKKVLWSQYCLPVWGHDIFVPLLAQTHGFGSSVGVDFLGNSSRKIKTPAGLGRADEGMCV